MLKITTHTDAQTTTLQLEGRLVGPWVKELERCWDSIVNERKIHVLRVDLSAVTYVDAGGKDLLRKMYRQGATLVAAGCLTSCIVDEIMHVGRGGGHAK